MKTLVTAALLTTMLIASTAFALERPPSVPPKGTEGPDVGHSQPVPQNGIEGPDVR
jgi:hypothetical protein